MHNSKSDNTEFAISTAVKALTKSKDLDVSFSPSNKDTYTLSGNYLNLPFGNNVDILKARGLSDLAASQLAFKDENLHAKNLPQQSYKAEIFNGLEQMRHSILLGKNFTGARDNIISHLHNKIDSSIVAEDKDLISFIGMTKYFKSQYKLPTKYAKNTLAKSLQEYDLKALFEQAENQAKFQSQALKFIRFLFDEEEPEETAQDEEESDNQESDNLEQETQSSEQSSFGSKDEEGDSSSELDAQETSEKESLEEGKTDSSQDKSKVKSYESDGEMPSGSNNYFEEGQGGVGYRVFTTQFDEIIHADKIASNKEIIELRHRLDEEIKRINVPYNRLFAKLYRLLISLNQSKWQFDLDEGLIDGSRLASLVTKHDNHNIYKSYEDSPFADTTITLLLDNSGSMRGRPIVTASACAEILMRVLEQCKIKTEILGFTTKEWKGGEAKKLWEEQLAGNKAISKPGRLNDLRHVIYKSADESARKASRNLGVMLKDGLLKENIDGEALIWAHERLAKASEKRKILLVISDGAPVDDSTATANDAGFLSLHLQHIINEIESKSNVEMLAIGIGHDVSRYYKNSVTIANVEELGETLIEKLVQLFAKK